jgi:cyclic pyranopterin phosphate synthase
MLKVAASFRMTLRPAKSELIVRLFCGDSFRSKSSGRKMAAMRDVLNRPLRDLRISVTDRCNFRCTYCMPKEIFGSNHEFLPRGELLTFEEITRLVEIFTTLGVQKIRITGGEPLLRRNLEDLVAMLAQVEGVKDLTLTTNGSLLAQKAQALRAAGLHRLTVSLDSLKDEIFAAMNDVEFPVAQVLAGIATARKAGFSPIKINMVVKRGLNENCVTEMVKHFRGRDFILRFIEYMDVGNSNGWRMADVVTAQEILAKISEFVPSEELMPLPSNYTGEVARRFQISDGAEIGIIASVTQPFCQDCTRARLSANGTLYTCLFAAHGFDLRQFLRGGKSSDDQIAAAILKVWRSREDRYSELRTHATSREMRKVEMSHIGG